MLLYSWFFFLKLLNIYKCPIVDFKKIIKYIIYFKYILNMSGSGQVWRVCNFMTQTQPTRYKKIYCNPTRWVGLGRVGFGRLVDFLHTPSFENCLWNTFKIDRDSAKNRFKTKVA